MLGGLFFGGVLSAFVGAAAMTPVADLVARQRTGPPVIVGFTPAFWLLVPGALSLVGVAALLNGDSNDTTTLITVETMVRSPSGSWSGGPSRSSSPRARVDTAPADNLEVTPRHALPPGA